MLSLASYVKVVKVTGRSGSVNKGLLVVLSIAQTDRCAMCGTLLHGDVHLNSSACSNKKYGPPVDRNGGKLQEPDGAPSTLAQPPCLLRRPCTTVPGRCVCSMFGPSLGACVQVKQHLRFSPSLFAKEAPEVFQHDADSNRLRLSPGAKCPWLRHTCAADSASTWIFCVGTLIVNSLVNVKK